MSWDTMTSVFRSRAWSSASIVMMPRWTTTSSAVVGSSARITCGWRNVASATITRWRIPPLSWCG